jgi:hypothetical protein
MSTNVKINFHVPADLYQWLTAESERTGVPSAELSRRALNAFRYSSLGDTPETVRSAPAKSAVVLRG